MFKIANNFNYSSFYYYLYILLKGIIKKSFKSVIGYAELLETVLLTKNTVFYGNRKKKPYFSKKKKFLHFFRQIYFATFFPITV